MTAELKTYPVMKDSGVPWLGEVPAHWDMLPLCAVARPKSITGQQHRELLSVYLDRGVIRFSEVEEKRTNVTSEDLSRYQAVDPGDFVLNNQQAWRGSVGVSNLSGIVSPAYLVLSLSPRLHPGFANLLFRGQAMVIQYLICSRGVGSIQRNLYWPHLRRVVFPSPPLPEQTAIVRFLDHTDRRIQRYLRAKQKLMALLEEQKQAIIHQAVTGQIDVRTGQPYPAYKPSGVEWLGEVPAHWDVQRTKVLFRLRTEKSGIAHGRELLSIYTHIGVRPRKDLEEKGNKASTTDDYWIVKRGDLIANKLLAWMGAIGVSHYDGVTSPAYDILTPIVDLASDYYHHLFRTRLYLQQFKQRSRGIMDMRLRLYFDQLGQIPILAPPVDEQQAIVNFYNEVIAADTDNIINQTRRQIELLSEYRTRLIADVVTGKLDVREAAAALPEVDPLAAEDTLDDIINTDAV